MLSHAFSLNKFSFYLHDWSSLHLGLEQSEFDKTYWAVSVIELEFFSSLESSFPGALHLQSTVELVLQYLSHGVLHHHFDNESSYTVDWRWRAPGKSNSNEEKNSNKSSQCKIPVVITGVWDWPIKTLYRDLMTLNFFWLLRCLILKS